MKKPYAFIIREGHVTQVIPVHPEDFEGPDNARFDSYDSLWGYAEIYARSGFLVAMKTINSEETNWYVRKGLYLHRVIVDDPSDVTNIRIESKFHDLSDLPQVKFLAFNENDLAHQVLLADAVPYVESQDPVVIARRKLEEAATTWR